MEIWFWRHSYIIFGFTAIVSCIRNNVAAIWGFLNINMPSYQYEDSHKQDKIVSWLFYLWKSRNMKVGILKTDEFQQHYSDVIICAMASQITSLTIVYSTVYSDADQRKHQSSASLAFVRGIHMWHVNSPHKWSVTRKMRPFNDDLLGCLFPWGLYLKCYHHIRVAYM